MRKQQRTPIKAKRSAPLYLSLIRGCEEIAGAVGARLICAGLLMALPGLLGVTTLAASFDCGSTGAYGPMNITNNTTLDLPPDGIFNCTTITVAAGNTLTFNRNPLNTPVYLLATGDVVINGAISLTGSWNSLGSSTPAGGGPGGFDGGCGGSTIVGQTQGGDGLGPGAISRGDAMFAGSYGNLLLVPLIGGSGGCGSDTPVGSGRTGTGGPGGGGAILIASNTRVTLSGSVVSRGSGWDPGVGFSSGGGVRIVAPVVAGTGVIDVRMTTDPYGNPRGGIGRIRVDCQDNQAYRNLALYGLASRGAYMVVFPTVIPRLDITQVAGQTIAEGTNNAVQFALPLGASTNQTVTVQARNFTNDVPIRVMVTPETGPSASFDAVISQASGNPPSATVPVVIPAGSVCQINAWTR